MLQTKVNTEGDNSCFRLRKLEKLFEDVPLLDEESNDYNIITNFEILKQFSFRSTVWSGCLLKMIYRVAWVVLIKSILFVETALIKNTHIHQNNDKKCQKVKDADDMILT